MPTLAAWPYPLPTLRLARLAVDQRVQDHGVGRALLRHVLHIALDQRDKPGCVGVFAHARPGAIAFYEGLGFVPLVGIREGSLHGEPIPMFLPPASLPS
ncbi:MAG: GNAT family N-acetyltransferase [Candidatus Xenobia bacterium]